MKKKSRHVLFLVVVLFIIGITALLFWLNGKNKEDVDEASENRIQSETSQKVEAGTNIGSGNLSNTEVPGKEEVSTSESVETTTADKSPARSEGEKKSHGSYYTSYWDDIEKAKEEDPDYVEENLGNLITLMKNAKERKNNECEITFEDVDSDTTLLYRVKNAYISDTLDGLEVDTDDVLSLHIDHVDGALMLQEGYQYAVVDLEVRNNTPNTIYDVPMNCYSYCLIDDEGTEYSSEFSYGTLQPGRNPQHRYFVSEMAAGETMSTTVIFVIPKDEQFDTYSHFIKIDPTGVGDNTLEWVDMICLDSVIGK